MTLAQHSTAAQPASPPSPAILAIALAVLLLFAAIGLVILLGGQPAPAAQAAARDPVGRTRTLAKAGEPACAAALAKARDTRGLGAQAAIAASTAMLRACDVG